MSVTGCCQHLTHDDNTSWKPHDQWTTWCRQTDWLRATDGFSFVLFFRRGSNAFPKSITAKHKLVCFSFSSYPIESTKSQSHGAWRNSKHVKSWTENLVTVFYTVSKADRGRRGLSHDMTLNTAVPHHTPTHTHASTHTDHAGEDGIKCVLLKDPHTIWAYMSNPPPEGLIYSVLFILLSVCVFVFSSFSWGVVLIIQMRSTDSMKACRDLRQAPTKPFYLDT